MTRALLRTAAVTAALALLTARPARAQSSPYLPTDDVAYLYIDALQARGELRALSGLERPYTVQAVRAALADVPTGAGRARWVRAVEGALDKHYPAAVPTDSALFSAAVVPYVVGQSSAVRELMRADAGEALTVGGAARLLLHTGRVTAVARGYGDQRLRDDPDFRGKRDRIVAGRLEDAYVAAQWPLVELSVGRTGRRWAPLGVQGLQVGDYVYSYDHLLARIGGERLHLASIVAPLEDLRLGAGPDSLAHRYFTAHRLAGRFGQLEVGLTESILYGGVDRSFDLSLASPTNVYSVSQYAEDRNVNVLYGADFSWRPRWVGSIGAQFMLDDVQIDDCGLGCEEPPSYGVAVSVEGVPLAGDVRGFGSYSRLSSLAYRTINPWERYSSFDVGLGFGYSDYDETRFGLDLGALVPVPLRVYAALRRQGAGSYRDPFPAAAELPITPTFNISPSTRVFRVGVSGGGRLPGGVELRGDIGLNQLHDPAVAAEGSRTQAEGRVTVALESARLRFLTGVR